MLKHFLVVIVGLNSLFGIADTFFPTTVAQLINSINSANTNGEDDVIDLGELNFSLNVSNYANDLTDGRNGLPSILSDGGNQVMFLNGSLTRSSISDGDDFRLLHASPGATLVLINVTIEDGLALASDISVLGDSGGAVFVNQATLIVISSKFLSNRANTFGGAITTYAGASALLINSSFHENHAQELGGAIHNDSSSLIRFIFGCTFAFNTAGRGGALSNFQASINNIINSTFSYNIAHNEGGAISNTTNGDISNTWNSTIANNFAGFFGGGIFNEIGSTISSLESSIVADNTSINDPDISGTIIAASYNLVGIDVGHTIVNGIGNNQVGSIASPKNPLLEKLADNGGHTETRALLLNSPAIDAGSNPNAEDSDQRGLGFNRIGGSEPDIGAYEIQ